MPLYGQFETVRVLSHGAVASIETARRVDGTGGDDYVVKAFRPFASATDEDAQRQLQLFLEQAEAQRAVASITGAHWAPVYEFGKQAETAFYVTDRFDVHASQLIHGRAKLSESNLFEVLSGAAKGLLELQRVVGRPHGNLKPTNVLIKMGRRGGSARAVLSDPLPTSRIDHDRDAAFDRNALGELLFGLVTHKRYPGPAAWPIESDTTWLAIGRHGGKWCDLCNALLAPPDSGEPLSPEDIVECLERLRPRATAQASRWVAGLAAALLVGVAVWLIAKPGPGPGPDDPPESLDVVLVRFCEEAGWLEKVRTLFDLRDEDVNTDETAPGSDSTAVSDFDTLRQEISRPWVPVEELRIALKDQPIGRRGFLDFCGQVEEGDSEQPMANILRKMEGGEEKVRDAWRAVEEIRKALVDWKPETLAQRTDEYRELGLEQAAGTLDELLRDASFPELLVDTDWDEFEAARDTAAGFAASGHFKHIDTKLKDLQEAFKAVASELGQDNERSVIRPELVDDANLEQLFDNMERLHTALAKLGIGPDQPGKLSSLERKIGGIADSDHIKEAVEQVGKLREDLRSALYSSTQLEECLTGLSTWVTDFVNLENEIGTRLVSVEDKINDLDSRLRNPTGVTTLRELLSKRWVTELAGFKADQASVVLGTAEYTQLARDVGVAIVGFEAHRGALAQIEKREEPDNLRWIPERFKVERAKIRSVIHKGRKKLLREIAERISEPDRGAGDWESIGTTLDLWEKEDFNKWLAKRKDLLNGYVRIADQLDDAFGWDDAEMGSKVQELYLNWSDSDYLDADMKGIVKKVRDRVDRVKRVENIQSDDELQAEIGIVLDRGETDPAFTVAVWRKQCELAEHEPETLEAEIELLEVVNQVIGGLQSTVRQEVIAEVAANRWLAREQGLTERDDYPPLLAQRGIFHIADKLLDSRLKFNINLQELRGDTVGNDNDEPQQKASIRGFIDRWERQTLPHAVDRVLDGFKELLSDEEPPILPSEIGPVFTYLSGGGGGVPGFKGTYVRWDYDKQQSVPENGILSYTWERQGGVQKHRLTFRQVQLSDDGPVTYLSIDEVSVGLFWDLVTRRADYALMNGMPFGSLIWEDLAEALPGGNPTSSPVAWNWNDEDSPTGIVFTGQWMQNVEGDYYEGSVDVDRLVNGHPIQQITPAAAIYVARLIGCRLPTIEEWSQAASPVASIFGGSPPDSNDWNNAVGSALDEELPNLRDETWKRQWDYLAGLREPMERGTRRNSLVLPKGFGSPPTAEEGQEVDWDDQSLWFRPTSQVGSRFRNIIGNVAEFVRRNNRSILSEGGASSAKDIYDSLRADKDDLSVQVIGGSALSDSAYVPVMEAQLIKHLDYRYPDVGFRLAFTAEPLKQSWDTRLAKLMDPTPPFVFYSAETTDPLGGSSGGS